ncbi:MAG TPA: S6e family ribosomal protein [archaeon]|nr:S6e family ribosomal protein [archaeon]
MNIVISDPKTGKAYSKNLEEKVFLNKKIGETVDLSAIGLEGYQGRISGGSNKAGFPMKKTLPGTSLKKIFIKEGTGFKPRIKVKKKKTSESKTRKFVKGVRVRKTVRGNTIADDVHQINLIVTKEGKQKLEEIFKKEEKAEAQQEAKKEEKQEEKKAEKKEEKKEKK